jgi:hypothetical protein
MSAYNKYKDEKLFSKHESILVCACLCEFSVPILHWLFNLLLSFLFLVQLILYILHAYLHGRITFELYSMYVLLFYFLLMCNSGAFGYVVAECVFEL